VQASDGHRVAGCVFCALEGSGRVLLENEGHSLVIPRRHGADGLELHQPEWNAVVELLKLRREQLSAQDATISGWAGLLNARGGLNSGEAIGRTLLHARWHLIPRRTGDDKSPQKVWDSKKSSVQLKSQSQVLRRTDLASSYRAPAIGKARRHQSPDTMPK
jgi:ATP adenylyltransferase